MGRIQVLPPEVIAQIAAGEVVERPFSVVKELVENALDAGATRLRVELEEGGLRAIRVVDDGVGFLPEDLEFAFVSHATSKLSALADLEHVASLGFRGEALASIGSVSRATIRSRAVGPDGSPLGSEGAEVQCEGGAIGPLKPCGTPLGTSIEIRDLFFNTPVRRRFVKSARAEKTRIHDLLVRTVLPRLDVDVTLVHEGKVSLHLPSGDSLTDRIVRAFGRTYADRLWTVGPTSRGPYSVSGLIAEPELSRKDSTMELSWVNGRTARDKSTMFAVREAFRGHLLHGRYPVTFLMLEVPPDTVDVNCHPTKTEVRFAEARQVAGLMHEAVREALEARGGLGLAMADGADGPRPVPPPRGGLGPAPAPRAGFPTAAIEASLGLSRGGSSREGRSGSRSGGSGVANPAARVREDHEPFKRGGLFEDPDSPRAAVGTPRSDERVADSGSADADSGRRSSGERGANPFTDLGGQPAAGGGGPTPRFLQVHDLYIVLATPDGLAVVDQHALHERVVYERLVRRHAERAVEIQRLLVPAVIEIPTSDKEWLLASAEVLAEEGLLIEDFGGSHAIAVHGVPAALGRRADPERLIGALIDGGERPSARAEVLERFHSMACRASVMAGDRLDESEIEALLAEAATLEHPHNCPHGRPTVLTFDGAALERWFRRRV